MKATWAYITDRHTAEFREVDVPDEPGPRQLLVRTIFSAISPGTELAIYTALDPNVFDPQAWCSYPYASGYTAVGEVVAAGPDTEPFAPGDIVYGFLGHRSFQLVSLDRFAYKPPAEFELSLVPFARFATIALTSILRSSMQIGDVCLVFGLGCVGLMAAQLARAAGATVVGVDPVQFRRAKAAELGIDFVVPPDDAQIRQALNEAGGKQSCEIAIDAVGSSEVIDFAVPYVADYGELVIVGSPRASYQADLTPLTQAVHLRGVTLIGALEWLIPVDPARGTKHNYYRNTDTVLRLHAQGRIDLSALRTAVWPWHRLPEAYEALLHDKEHFIGIALDWTAS